jgi:tRNA(Arg) A34 adenosine deaminase TadA
LFRTDVNQDATFLSRALELAQQNVASGEGGPFGAVIVRQGKIISEGWNQVIASHDPTAHAEIMAIRSASQLLGSPHLRGCTLYTSSEPCPMCLAAAYWAKVEEIVFANTRAEAAGIGFCDEDLYEEICRPLPERGIPIRQHRLDGALQPMQDWFANPKRRDY